MNRLIYREIRADEVPEGLRWDTPGWEQGRIVSTSYADHPTPAGESGPGARYRRITDSSLPIGRQSKYYVRGRLEIEEEGGAL